MTFREAVRQLRKLRGVVPIQNRPCLDEVIDMLWEHVKSTEVRVDHAEYAENMIREYRELRAKYEELHKISVKYEAGTLEFTPTCSIELIKRHKRAIGEYLNVLEIIAEIEGINL